MKTPVLALTIGLLLAPQVFRSRVDAVRVDALVTDEHGPIADLTLADFVLKDNGVVQALSDAEIRDVPFSLLLALDTSTSVQGDALADLKQAAHAAVDALRPDDRVSLLTFTDGVRTRADWNDSRAQVVAAIDATRAGGSTSLFDASFAALSLRDGDSSRRSLVVLFTDGDDTTSWLPADAVYDRASHTDSVVYAVQLERGAAGDTRHLFARSGVTLSGAAPIVRPEPFLPELARRTGGDLLVARDSRMLRETFARIVQQFRTRYLLTYEPKDIGDGWHQIEVTVKRPGAKVTARRGYLR